ncbi:phosphomannomutase/phosphoglucomutase [Naumannella halotolerans]|uniref:Phosphomannomutase n=1 Tax=Naumannella halotolerans TaxID=993414 RepID=A0A4R7JBP4_9ACTN|nr:phosphomannomutase/phosphoglucomutase [Naumannella halotolerans]TDT34097.1 phosphomannomutase [Naumannella halotolerans]
MLQPQIFKANDIRGLIAGSSPEWDVAGAEALGTAFAQTLQLRPGDRCVLGRDMRESGVELGAAFARGVARTGVDVVDIGLASTDQLWFASGSLDLPGAQLTASHNPAAYNGIKFCLAGARPMTPQMLIEIRDRAWQIERDGFAAEQAPGRITEEDLLPAYSDYLRSLVDLSGMRHLRVVVDAGNGMAGLTAPVVLAGLDLELIGLYLELDGSFPNHQPNPLEPENLVDAQRAVREHGADCALVFDGDADRCFVIDDQGEVVMPSAITAMIAAAELQREPGGVVVRNTITSRTVAEVVAEAGGRCVTSKVGHTFVKAAMAANDAIFGGEHSAHYYFRDFWSADTGMLAGLHVLSALGRSDKPLSELLTDYNRYVASGEINSTVDDAQAVMNQVAEAFAGRGEIDFGDGVMINAEDWWVSLRPSNTEPLLRLNVEARSRRQMDALRDEVLALVRS